MGDSLLQQHRRPSQTPAPPSSTMGPRLGPHRGLPVTLLQEVLRSGSPHTCGHATSLATSDLARVECFSISLCKDRCVRGG